MTIVMLSVAVVIALLVSLAIHALGYDSLSVPSGVGVVVDVAAVGLLVAFGWAVAREMRGRLAEGDDAAAADEADVVEDANDVALGAVAQRIVGWIAGFGIAALRACAVDVG